MRKSFLVLVVLTCSNTILAQQQRVSIAVVKEDAIPKVELSNWHNAAIEGFVITSEHAGAKGYQDTIIYDVHVNYKHDVLIQPGSSQQIGLAVLNVREVPTPTLRAVIFSDGTTAGEEFWIRQLLNKRKVLADTLGKVMSLLQDMIAQSLSRQQALSALQAAWDERIRGYNSLTAEEREASERVFYSASSTLELESSRYLTPDEDSSKPLSRVMRSLNRWRADIQSAALASPKPDGAVAIGQPDSQKVE